MVTISSSYTDTARIYKTLREQYDFVEQADDTKKYVKGNIGALINIIKTYYPDAVLPVSAA